MSRFVVGVGLLFTIFAGTAMAGDEVVLRYKLGKDDKLIYRTETSLKQTQTVAGQDVETVMANKGVTVRSLDKIDEKGNIRIKSEEQQIRVELKVGPLGEYVFDSTSDKREEGSVLATLNPLYEKLKNAVTTTVITPRGDVLAVEGIKDLLEDVIKDNPLAQQFSGGASEQAHRLSLAELYPMFAEKAVKPGETWETKYVLDLPQLGKAEGKRIYTYEGPDKVGERKTVRIRMTHELAFDLDLVQGGAKITGKMQVEQSSGVIQFDPEKGQLISMDNTYQIGGNLNVDAAGKLIPVKSSQTQTVKVELLDKLPEVKKPTGEKADEKKSPGEKADEKK